MLEKERQQLILDIVDEKEFVSVKELTAMLHSSEATIRRDLEKMSSEGQIQRIRGGAQALTKGESTRSRPSISSSLFHVELGKQTDVKRLIARRAVELCQDDDAIIINGGSSTFMMGEFLRSRTLSVLTNSFVLAQELAVHSDNLVTLPGGELFRKQGIVVSTTDNDLISSYAANKMFMGTPGISSRGVTESDLLLLNSEQKLLRQSEQLIVLADSTKIGKHSNFILCPLQRVDILITDSLADPDELARMRDAGVEVIVVEHPVSVAD